MDSREVFKLIEQHTRWLHKYFRRVSVAGGSIRDLENGRDIKDVDIYIYCSSDDLSKLKPLLRRKKLFPKYEGYSNPLIHEVWTSIDTKVELIFIDCPLEKFIEKTFDIGLCEVWVNFDTDGIMMRHSTEKYNKDVANKTLTCYFKERMSRDSVGKTMLDHLPRVMAKYSDYKVEIEYE